MQQCRSLLRFSILIHLHGNSIWPFQMQGKRVHCPPHHPSVSSRVTLLKLSNNCVMTVPLLTGCCYADNNKTFAFIWFHHSSWRGYCGGMSIHMWSDTLFPSAYWWGNGQIHLSFHKRLCIKYSRGSRYVKTVSVLVLSSNTRSRALSD